MAFPPPVNIPTFGDQDYASELYGMISGVGDRWYEGKRAKVADRQWEQDYAAGLAKDQQAQANADRNYALELRKMEADAAATDDYFAPQWAFNEATGEWGLVQPSKAGGQGSLVGMPDGYRPMPPTSNADLGPSIQPVTTRGGLPVGAPLQKSGDIPAGHGQTGLDENGLPTVAPYPGSEQDADAQKRERERVVAQTKARMQLDAAHQQAGVVTSQVDAALADAAEDGSTGFGGRIERMLPWETSGGNLASRLETIKGNISFDKLQSMRELSPTGGALGQVSDFENRLLLATQGPLDPNNPTTMNETLLNVKEKYEEAVVAHEIAYMTDFEGLDRDIADQAIEAIRAGKDPQAVLQRVQELAGG